MTDPARIGGATNWQTNPIHLQGTGSSGGTATVGPTGTLGNHTVQQQATANPPGQRGGIGASIAKFFTKTLPDFFKDVGTTLGKLFSSAPAAQKTFEANRTELRSQLPFGITIDDHGAISGRQVIHTMPKSNFGSFGDHNNATVDKAFTDNAQADHGRQTAVLGGVTVSGRASADLCRQVMTVERPQGAPYSSASDPLQAEERSAAIVGHLHALTGNDESATRVLTSIMNQDFTQLVVRTPSNEDGDPIQTLPGKSAFNYTYRSPDGTESVVKPPALGGASFEVSRSGDDYEVRYTYQSYAPEAGMSSETGLKPLAGMDGGVVQFTYTATFVVDGHAASQGQAQITFTDPLAVEYRGKMAAVQP